MNEERFERVWNRAEAAGYAARLASEYPSWRSRQRRRTGFVVGIALTIALSVPMLYSHLPEERVYCNNQAFDENHWRGMASTLLMEA